MKEKRGHDWGDPLEMVTAEKLLLLRRASSEWLASYPEHARCTVRFDVVAVSEGRLERLGDAF